jgi:negative regulator of flagellin synthesis FlgM
MEIGRNNRADLAKLLLGVQGVDRNQSRQPSLSGTGQQDRVQISEHAKELQRIKALLDQPDPARDARVEQIRRSVEAGTYTMDGKKVADSMIRQVLTDSVL